MFKLEGLLCALALSAGAQTGPVAAQVHVWEKQEITLKAGNSYPNPYVSVDVWVDLAGPGFSTRVHGFWDGENVFRVRVLATAPGQWSWKSGSNQADAGLNGRSGTFRAVAWSEAEKEANPNRRGFIRATPNGHALQYADGTPYIILGDTWWSVGTFRFPWFDDDTSRPIGPGAGIKDYARLRKSQGFNLIGMLLSFPAWAHDGKPALITVQNGDTTVTVRGAWAEAGTECCGPGSRPSPKEEYNEGGRPFLFPGRVPGNEDVFPDVDRINPAFFTYVDRKVDYLNEQGFVVFMEALRRDMTEVWKYYYKWPDAYARYLQYMFTRYGANNTLLSPVHLDANPMAMPSTEFVQAIRMCYDKIGPPPFGNLVTTNTAPSTHVMWQQPGMDSTWLTLHQTGNSPREHVAYWWLTDSFFSTPAIPGFQGEPYYSGGTVTRYGAPGGTETDSRYVRSSIYGSFLSGGLGGHLMGSEAIWGADIEPGFKTKMWDAFLWDSANSVKHLKTFAMSQGKRYQDLIPDSELVTPNRTHRVAAFEGWAYAAATKKRDYFLVYWEKGSHPVPGPDDLGARSAGGGRGFAPAGNVIPGVGFVPNTPGVVSSAVRGLIALATYEAKWFDPRKGIWLDVGTGTLQSNISGWVSISDPPSDDDWGLRLVLKQ